VGFGSYAGGLCTGLVGSSTGVALASLLIRDVAGCEQSFARVLNIAAHFHSKAQQFASHERNKDNQSKFGHLKQWFWTSSLGGCGRCVSKCTKGLLRHQVQTFYAGLPATGWSPGHCKVSVLPRHRQISNSTTVLNRSPPWVHAVRRNGFCDRTSVAWFRTRIR
jgi:hypothetical protein